MDGHLRRLFLEEQESDTELFLKTLTKTIPFPIDIVDDQGHVLYQNARLEQMLTGQQQAGTKCWELYRDDHTQCENCPLRRGVGAREVAVTETHPCFNGRTLRIWHTAMSFKGKHCILEIFVDITDFKRAEEKLKCSEARYRSYIELTQQLAWTTNPKGEVEEPIPSWTRFTGQSEQEVRGWGWSGAVHPEDIRRTVAAWKKAVASKTPYEVEYRLRREDGVYRVFLARGVPVLDDAAEIREWVGTCIDITDLRCAEASAREANELRAQFIAMASHELRSPLAVIDGNIDCLLDGLVGELTQEQSEMLEGVHRNIQRLIRLSNGLLDYEKIMNRRMPFDFKHQNLNEIIREVVQQWQPRANQKNLFLKYEPDAELPPLLLDRDRIIQILVNLIDNALKVTDAGNVTVTAENQEQGVTVCVQDTGPGIREEDRSRLFRPFAQLSPAHGEKRTGTGLGLAICNEIVAGHGGRIWVESENGQGTSFFVWLPHRRPV